MIVCFNAKQEGFQRVNKVHPAKFVIPILTVQRWAAVQTRRLSVAKFWRSKLEPSKSRPLSKLYHHDGQSVVPVIELEKTCDCGVLLLSAISNDRSEEFDRHQFGKQKLASNDQTGRRRADQIEPPSHLTSCLEVDPCGRNIGAVSNVPHVHAATGFVATIVLVVVTTNLPLRLHSSIDLQAIDNRRPTCDVQASMDKAN